MEPMAKRGNSVSPKSKRRKSSAQGAGRSGSTPAAEPSRQPDRERLGVPASRAGASKPQAQAVTPPEPAANPQLAMPPSPSKPVEKSPLSAPDIPYASALHRAASTETEAQPETVPGVSRQAPSVAIEAAPSEAQPASFSPPTEAPSPMMGGMVLSPSRVSDMPVRDVSAPAFSPPPESPATAELEAIVPEAEPASPAGDEAAAGPAAGAAAPSSAPPLLFEVAWEVCWQLGGIYTVLRSKAAAMLSRWGDRYCLIGPYNPNTAAVEFEEQPAEGYVREALDRLRDAGIPCHYGRWLIAGRPRVILLDYRARYRSLDVDKYLLWKDHGISTLVNDGEVNEVVAFGFTVAEFFRQLTSVVTDRAILAHFHEWMGGLAVPRIAHLRLPVATIFTTHAHAAGPISGQRQPRLLPQPPLPQRRCRGPALQHLPALPD